LTAPNTTARQNKVRNLRAILDSTLTLLVDRKRGKLGKVNGRKVQRVADELREWAALTA
jgi:hypothetical protein